MKRPTLLQTLALLIVVASLPVLAAEAPAPLLTLDEAVEIASRNNHLIGAADADVAAAEATVQESRSGRQPRLDLLETVSRTTNPVFVFGNKLNQGTFGPSDFDFDTLNNPDAINNFNTMLRVRYALYSGGQVSGAWGAPWKLNRFRVIARGESCGAEQSINLAKEFLGIGQIGGLCFHP